MNKVIIMSFMIIFELAGNFVPMIFGVTDIFSLWGIAGGVIGGFFGIWVGYKISKRLG